MFAAPLVAKGAALLSGTTAATVGTALSAGGALYSGISQIQTANYQAGVLRNQAEQDRLNAAASVATGQITAQDKDFAAVQQMEQLLARQAGSGFSVDSASFAQRRNDLKVGAELDRSRIMTAAENEATNYLQRAAEAEAQAGVADARASALVPMTALSFGTSLISGASSISDAMARKVRRDATGIATNSSYGTVTDQNYYGGKY